MIRSTRRQVVQRGLALAGLSLVSGCGQLSLPWQRSGHVPHIGWLSPVNGPGSREFEGLRAGLHELGYLDDTTFVLDSRLSGGDNERMPSLAAELVALGVDVIVTDGLAAALAARDASHTIPIVMGVITDPVGTGLVASLAHPGGNLTGFDSLITDINGKRLELLKATLPHLARVAALHDPASGPSTLTDLQAAGRALDLEVVVFETRTPDDLESAFAGAVGTRVDGVVVTGGPLQAKLRRRIVELAVEHRLPGMFGDRDYAVDGGLLAYGPNIPDIFRRSAGYVDKILKGARPADLPIQQPTKLDFVVNLRTAQALGLTIPPSVLQQATEVIQ